MKLWRIFSLVYLKNEYTILIPAFFQGKNRSTFSWGSNPHPFTTSAKGKDGAFTKYLYCYWKYVTLLKIRWIVG